MTRDATADPLLAQLNDLLPLASAAIRNAGDEAAAMMEYMDKLIDQEWVDKLREGSLDVDVLEFLGATAHGQDLPLKHKRLLDPSPIVQ